MRYQVLRLKKAHPGDLRPGHPWIYRSQIPETGHSINAGELVSIIDSKSNFIGNGYYNPSSEISARILSFKDEEINKNFFEKRIKAAFEKRKELLSKTNAYRLIFSESDGLPGLIADVYNNTVVFQTLTLGMDKLKKMAVTTMSDMVKPEFIYEKNVSPFRAIEGLKDTLSWWDQEEGNKLVEIHEGKVKFLVDINKGHKTGFYLDQRNSRMGLMNISKGKKVLDLFCYTGGFAISAAVFGAGHVKGVDIKEDWLNLARDNAKLNNIVDKTEFVKDDAFSALKDIYERKEKFDIIIIDPPSFLKTKRAIKTASMGYAELNSMAVKSLSEGGILATFSCSHNMSNNVFSNLLKKVADEAGKKFTILKRCRQANDHPIVKGILETEYLKGYFLKVESK